MKKILITILSSFVLLANAVHGQSLQDGISDVYAGRFQGAKATFEKLLASNPNNIDATYWLGQAYLGMDDVAGAKAVYDKALMASANAPLVIVGMGQVELKQNKISEARQRFEAAITMTRGKKGDDPVILNAVGRAITNTYDEKEKKGDINYAVEKLEAAAARDPKNADIFLNLGNAYRKARPGENGGKAFETYKKAIEVNPNFAPPYHRLAQLFNTQRNYDLYEQYLNQAIEKDPKFAPAYYDMYYQKLGKRDFAAAQDVASKYIANSDPDPQADHFKAQTYWAEKKYDEAIAISKDIISKAGANVKPRSYVLLADAYLSKGDTAAAKPFIDQYFAKAKGEEITPVHIIMKANIYSAIPGQEDSVYAIYMNAYQVDTVMENKMDILKKAAEFFKAKKQYAKESDFRRLYLANKPNPTINDMFSTGIAYYFATRYDSSRNVFLKIQEKFPEQEYGWEWAFNSSKVLDTTKKDSIAVPDALKLLAFSQKDSVKFKKQYINAASYLAAYYANDAGDKTKALDYLYRLKNISPERADDIQKNIEILQQANTPRQQNRPAATPRATSGGSK
jgi:tetratricopeptide (TPR) repeat protein